MSGTDSSIVDAVRARRRGTNASAASDAAFAYTDHLPPHVTVRSSVTDLNAQAPALSMAPLNDDVAPGPVVHVPRSASAASALAQSDVEHDRLASGPASLVMSGAVPQSYALNDDGEAKQDHDYAAHAPASEVARHAAPTARVATAARVAHTCTLTRAHLAEQFRNFPELFAYRAADGTPRQPSHVLDVTCLQCRRDFESHSLGLPDLNWVPTPAPHADPRSTTMTSRAMNAHAPSVDIDINQPPSRAQTPISFPMGGHAMPTGGHPSHSSAVDARSATIAPPLRYSSSSASSAMSAPHFNEAQSKMMEKMLKFTSKITHFDPSTTANCYPFLESIRRALYSSGVDSVYWYRILPRLVVGEHVALWVQHKLVESSPASWEDACQMFTSHYQRVNYKALLSNEYTNLKQSTSVQDFADRFRTLVTQLGKDAEDETVWEDFLNRVKPHVQNGYKQVAHQFKLFGQGEFRPRDLDHVIEICVDAEQAHQKSITNVHYIEEQRKRNDKERTPAPSTKSVPKTAKPQSSTIKHCDLHGKGGHSTAECKVLKNKENASTAKPNANASGASTKPPLKPAPSSSTGKLICYNCQQPGHTSHACPLPRKTAPRVNALTFGTSASDSFTEKDVVDVLGASGSEEDPFSDEDEEEDIPRVSTLSLGKDVDHSKGKSSKSPYGTAQLILHHKDRDYRVNCDSGADISVMHFDCVLEDAIPYSSRDAGHLQGADASMLVKRVGRTAPLVMTVTYHSAVTAHRHAPRTLRVQFEIMRFDDNRKYDVIIGKDLIHLLFPDGLPLGFMLPPVRLVDAMPAQVLSVTAGPDALMLVEGTSALSTNTVLEREYQPLREQLMQRPALVAVLNENYQLSGFCNRADACLQLRLKPRDQWPPKVNLCKSNYRNIHEGNIPAIDEAVNRWRQTYKLVPAPPGCPYNSPLVPAPKFDKDGNVKGTRVCLDFRNLNLVLENVDSFQLPRIRESLESLSDCTIFGEFDLSDAYLQFPLHEDSRPLTAFTWRGQQWMFTGCPFGIAVLPQHFQRVMAQVLEGLSMTFPYIDNIPLGSKSWDEHERMAIEIVRRLNAANLQLKPSSVNLGYPVLRVLGHQISARGVGVDPAKGEAVRNWPVPRTGKDLEKFLGFANFLQQYVRHFADLAGPLHALKAHKIINWSPADLECFETLKRAISGSPWLKHPDFTRQFCIATDASDTGIGGVLYQPDAPDGPVTPDNIVSIFSEKLNDAQRRYSAFKKELYGLVRALVRFERYVKYRDDLIIWTDHKPLRAIINSSPTDSKAVADRAVQGWLDTILEFKFKVEYRPGATNLLPDALSRAYSMAYPKQWGVPDPQNPRPDYRAMIGDRITLPAVSIITRARAAASSSASSKGEETTETNTVVHPPSLPSEPTATTDPATLLAVELERRGKQCPAVSERPALVETAHLWGHFGREAIYAELYRRGYWWPNMRQDIDRVTADCEPCMRFNVTKRGFDPAQYIIAHKPWDHVQIDTSVHMPASVDGNYTVLLVIIDVFTGFVILRACKSTDADEIARHLWDVFCIFGVPKILQSDNGPEFVNLILNTLGKIVGIDRRLITPYNPRADGKVERAIGTISNILKKCLNGAAHHWPLYLPFAMLAFNSKVAHLTGSSPFSLMLARAPNELRDYTQDPPKQFEVDFDADRPLWQDFVHKVMAIIHPSIVQRAQGQKDEMVKRLNAHRKALIPKPISAGTEVWLADRRLVRSKHEPNYLGPYWVVEAHRNGVYTLRDDNDRPLPTAVTRDMLKVRRVKEDSASSKEEFEFVDPDQVSRSQRYQQTHYEIERILAHRDTTIEPEIGGFDYKVRWRGYGEEDDSWVHESGLRANTSVREYWSTQTKPRAGGRKSKSN